MAEKHEPVKAEETAASVPQHPFPSGLRVLVVDDDPLCLKVVGHMLRRCNYEVTTSINGMSALEELRQHPNHYDLVLSDVYMPDMDGFKLLEHIGLELDLPVIMMSSNGETNVVLRGVTHGAVDFLIKPVRIEELRNAWQHVVRRRRESAISKDSGEEADEETAKRNDKKRKSDEKRKSGEHSDGEGTSAKKARVVWSIEMHQQFVNAVNTLGVDKAVPKRILDLMNVEGLTRENVASHLQKYRLYLRRVSGVAPTPGSGRGGGGKGVRMPGMPGVGQGASAAEPAAPGTTPAAAATAAPMPPAPGAEAQAAATPMAGFTAPPMGMQQAPMMQPGAAGAVPDHIMRMQLQTLQMQAMNLGVGAGLPGALPGASAPMMAGGMAAPGLQAIASGAMPPAGFGLPPGMTMGGMPGMAGMPTGMEFAMPPPGAFTGDMSWANLTGQPMFAANAEQQSALATQSAPMSSPGLQPAPEAPGSTLQQPQPQQLQPQLQPQPQPQPQSQQPQPMMQQPVEQQQQQQQQVPQHASPPPVADHQRQQQQLPQQPALQHQQPQPLQTHALQQAGQHQLQLSYDQHQQQQQMAAAVGQYPGLPFGPMGPQSLPGYPPQMPAFPQPAFAQHLQQQQPPPQQQQQLLGAVAGVGVGGSAAGVEDPKDGSMDDMLNFFLKDGNAPE